VAIENAGVLDIRRYAMLGAMLGTVIASHSMVEICSDMTA
jgi:hypothetical protein